MDIFIIMTFSVGSFYLLYVKNSIFVQVFTFIRDSASHWFVALN